MTQQAYTGYAVEYLHGVGNYRLFIRYAPDWDGSNYTRWLDSAKVWKTRRGAENYLKTYNVPRDRIIRVRYYEDRSGTGRGWHRRVEEEVTDGDNQA